MPVTKSAKRALRKSLKKKASNLAIRQTYKRIVKTARREAKDLSGAFSALDRAAKRGVIHKRKAARLKSRLSKLIKPAAAPKPSKPKAVKKR